MKLDLKHKIKENKIKLIVAVVLLALLILSFFFAGTIEKFLKLNSSLLTHQATNDDIVASSFKVSYIDVGQGNSTYIKFPDGKTMLIDGGNIEYGEKVAKILKDDGVTKIDYLVATHSDADHIGGLNFILKEFEVKNIFRPFQIAGTGTNAENFVVYEDEDLGEFYNYLQSENPNGSKVSRVTTSVYKNFITNIYNEFYIENSMYYHSNISVFYDGLIVEGDDYKIEFFAPLVRDENYNLINYSNTNGFATVGYGVNNSNDNSAIILIKIYNFSFLFTGDAAWTNNLYNEEITGSYGETDFINSLTEDEKLKFSNVTVFLLGHHGSSYSSSEEILSLINANFFVVSVEENSSFGHPASDTLARVSKYKKFDDYLLMTRDYGTITFGEINGNIKYSLEYFDENQKISISWYLLGSILYIFVVIVIFSIKTNPISKQKH